MGCGRLVDCGGQCGVVGASHRGRRSFHLAALGDGMTWLDWAEVVAAGATMGVMVVVGVSVALDNFNLRRRKR